MLLKTELRDLQRLRAINIERLTELNVPTARPHQIGRPIKHARLASRLVGRRPPGAESARVFQLPQLHADRGG